MNLSNLGDFLIIDLESTCWEAGNFDDRGKLQSEIIEIGGVLWRPKEGVLFDFSYIVKPVKHPTLSKFCTDLTTITQDMVDGGIPFRMAYESIRGMVASFEPIFTSWGDYDQRMIWESCHEHRVQYPFPAHLNLKRLFAKRTKQRLMSEDEALAFIGQPFTGTRHRGIDDAKNSAKILSWLINEEQPKPLP